MDAPPPKPRLVAAASAMMPPAAEQMAEYQARCATMKTDNVISAQPRRPPTPPRPSDEALAFAK
eukprot:1539128-Alexandrium_andersonii.AAC.1